MSDTIVKLIPVSPEACADDRRASAAAQWLEGRMKADSIRVRRWETPEFVDCGDALEEIRCPLCGGVLTFDWWGEAMDGAWKTGFRELAVTAPCCGAAVSLNDLRYRAPCGFSRLELELLNPAAPPDEETLRWLEERLGTGLRVIWAHL